MTGRPFCFLFFARARERVCFPGADGNSWALRLGSPPRMVAEKNESTRNLLNEIEGDWDTPRPRPAASPDVQAALDAAADRLVDSLDPPPVAVPTMDELDSGWGAEDEDDPDAAQREDDEANGPDLPDERLDPVAYALAKQAREERLEALRLRRRAKAETKKARRKARADAQKSKQKGKQRKARAPQKPVPSKEARNARRAAAARPARALDDEASADASDDDDDAVEAPSRTRAKLPPSKLMAKPMLSKTNQWMLAVAVLIFVAAAAFAAVVAR